MPGTAPKVTVILCTYNRPDYLGPAMASVVGQSLTDWELLVVNDGGADVGPLVRSFHDPRIVYHHRETNRGKAACCNFALEKARGQYVAYLDDDDLWYPQHLQLLAATLDQNPQAGAAYSDLYAVFFAADPAGGPRYPLHKMVYVSRGFQRDFILGWNNVLHVSLMHRKEAALRAGGYDETVRVMIDWNLTRKLAFFHDFIYVPQVTGEYSVALTGQDLNRLSPAFIHQDHIGTIQRRSPEEFSNNVRRIKDDLPPEPWPFVHKVDVIMVVSEWGPGVRTVLAQIIDDLFYPVRIKLIDNGTGRTRDEALFILGRLGELKNVSVITTPRKLNRSEAFLWGAGESSADFVLLLSQVPRLKAVTLGLGGCLGYLSGSSLKALKWPVQGPGDFDLLVKREALLKYGSGICEQKAEEIIDETKFLQAFQCDLALAQAQIHYKNGEFQAAYQALQTALAAGREWEAGKVLVPFLVELALKTNQLDLAEKECRALIARGYQPDHWVLLGRLLERKGEYPEAIEAYRSGLKTLGLREADLESPVFPVDFPMELGAFTAVLGLGRCCLQLGNLPEAARLFHLTARMWKSSHLPYLGLTKVFLQAGRLDQAQEAAAHMGGLDGQKNPEVHQVLGELGERRDKFDLAFSCYLKAFEYGAANEEILDRLHRTGARAGRLADLAELLEKILQKNPRTQWVAAELIRVYEELGQTDRAATLQNRVSGLIPAETKSKIGRNVPCPCGSGRKYKKCCLKKVGQEAGTSAGDPVPSVREISAEPVSLPTIRARDHESRRRAKLTRLASKNSLSLQIISPSDLDPDETRRPMWGDYWVKFELAEEFRRLGLVVTEQKPDVVIYLFGVPPENLPEDTYNIAWVYSHPDLITDRNLRRFDQIFSLSPGFSRKLEAMGYERVETMIGATSKRPLQVPIRHDMVFVGNSRGQDGRQVVWDIGPTPYDFKVWGEGWNHLLPGKYYGGRFWDYRRLDELYASARISINDHHPDMAREGFVAVKIFDILASGGFAISDVNAGIYDIFGETVPQYRSPEHLKALLERFINQPEERRRLMMKGRKIALTHTYEKRARQFLEAVRIATEKEGPGLPALADQSASDWAAAQVLT